MNERKRSSGDAKPAGNGKAMSSKVNGNRKINKLTPFKQPIPDSVNEDRPIEVIPSRESGKAKYTVDSCRRGLAKPSSLTAINKEMWKHIFAEVSAYKYPPFLHRLENKAKESEAVDYLYRLCKIMLTKEECREAAKSRITRRAARKEIKLYPENS